MCVARCLYGLGIFIYFFILGIKESVRYSIADNLELCQLINPLNIYCISKKFPKFHIRCVMRSFLYFHPFPYGIFVFRFKCLNDQTFSPFKKKRKNPILLLRISILLLVAAPMAMDSVCWRQPDGRDSLYIALSRTIGDAFDLLLNTIHRK